MTPGSGGPLVLVLLLVLVLESVELLSVLSVLSVLSCVAEVDVLLPLELALSVVGVVVTHGGGL
ncbi:MAG: hypothetical protein U0R81_07415 [Mycobacterium sp.]